MAQRKDWLALVAVHSDAWLMAVAFYYGAKFDGKERCGKRRLPPSASTDFRVFISALLAHNSSPLGPPSLSADRRRPPFRRRREKLFKHINSLPTVYEILSGKAVNKPKAKAKGAAAGQVSAIPTTAFLPNFPHCHALRSFFGGGAGDARCATSTRMRPSPGSRCQPIRCRIRFRRAHGWKISLARHPTADSGLQTSGVPTPLTP